MLEITCIYNKVYTAFKVKTSLIENRTFVDMRIMACSLIDSPVEEDGSNIDCSFVNTSICVFFNYREDFSHTKEYMMQDLLFI